MAEAIHKTRKRIRNQDALHKALRRYVRQHGGSVRTRLHSVAAERGAVAKGAGK